MMQAVRYVITEMKSQINGDWMRPYRKRCQIRSGLPRSAMIMGAPVIRASTVIASDSRVIGVLQFALVMRKMAETIVPPLLTPTQKTNVEIYMPQETSSRRPVTIRPLRSCTIYATKASRTHAARKLIQIQNDRDVSVICLIRRSSRALVMRYSR